MNLRFRDYLNIELEHLIKCCNLKKLFLISSVNIQVMIYKNMYKKLICSFSVYVPDDDLIVWFINIVKGGNNAYTLTFIDFRKC